MGRYVARRLLQMIPVFFGTTFLIFFAVFTLPGDPVRALFGDRRPPQEVIDAIREKYGLDDPFIVQYGKYMSNLFQGDFGVTLQGRDVLDVLSEAWPISIKLAVAAFAIEVIIGIVAGVLAGLRRGSFIDNLVLVSTTIVVSLPIFVIGFTVALLIGLPLARNGILPSSGVGGGWRSYVLPGFVLASVSLAYLARLTRSSLSENLRSDYVRTATAKGLPRSRVVIRHTLRNSLIPVVTLLGVDLGVLMGGAIVTESIFNIPGIGRTIFQGIQNQEGSLVVGITTVLVLIYLFATLLVDVLYALLDPRIRYD
ncbi:MAG: ABC transporter permease [Actinomycetota bacterium]|nr:ABC transporter permease [Actinomycetota bacterium]